MTDQENGQEKPLLNPLYKPAIVDCGVIIRFVGNTATVGHIDFMPGTTPFHLYAASAFLKFQADKMLAIQEMEQMEDARLKAELSGVAVPGAGSIARPAGRFKQG
ncbi:hypothetical protein LCGC14_2410180 [marine sediment metagenome]|uniref:Uncharacterized protein n=1 Tax=marine sediment metagenome TaxID=412755 RepID=A0A0F9EM64_9ZZZZ